MRPYYDFGWGGLKSHYRPFVPGSETKSGWPRVVWPFWQHWLNPMTYYRWIRAIWQRGWRGHAAHDYWNADSYLEYVILGVMKDLRENTHGYPAGIGGHYTPHVVNFGDDEPSDGAKQWNRILSEIIEGLEASIELRNEDTIPDGIYSSGPWHFEPVPGQPGISTLVDESNHKFDREAYEAWQAPLLQKRKRAMLLLCRYWGNFWD